MNQTIQENQAILQMLRYRVSLTTPEMYKMIGRKDPVRAPHFNVVPLDRPTFDVIDRSTGLSRGARTGHDSACDYARQFDQKTNGIDSVGVSVRRFGRILLRWTVGISVLLSVFAYYGAGH